MNAQPVRTPDLSTRPHEITVERVMKSPPGLLYAALTQGFDIWLAVPDSVRMTPAAREPFYFETEAEGERVPHYGRFLRLEPERAIEFTWVTRATEGVETVVTIGFVKQPRGIRLRLRHAGFPAEEAARRHEREWLALLERLDSRLSPAD